MSDLFISYTILFEFKNYSRITVGKLGSYLIPRGRYIYTGSAKTNIDQRIIRHRSNIKKLHWHIDYLLNDANCNIISIEKSKLEECLLNQTVKGTILIPGFGSTDCKNHCGSHLKRI